MLFFLGGGLNNALRSDNFVHGLVGRTAAASGVFVVGVDDVFIFVFLSMLLLLECFRKDNLDMIWTSYLC